MADYKLVYHEETPATLKYTEAKIKPETVGEITPTYEPQTVYPPSGTVFGRVEVEGIPLPTEVLDITENGSYNVARIGTAEVAVEPDLQTRTVTPTKQTQTVEPDSGYDGLERVTVEPIPPEYIVPSGTLNITENAEGINVTDKAAVNVAVPIPEPPSGTLGISENGSYDVREFESVNVDVHPDFGVTFGDWNAQGFPTSLTTYGYTTLPAWMFFEAGYNGYNRPIIYGWIDKIRLNEGITTINKQSIFRTMEKVTKLKMPSTLRTLGGPFTFYQTPLALLDLSLIDTVVTLTADNIALDAGCVIRVKSELLNDYKNADNWKNLPNEWEGI